MLFKEIVDARMDARTDDGRRTLKDHKSSLEHFVKRTVLESWVGTWRPCVLGP